MKWPYFKKWPWKSTVFFRQISIHPVIFEQSLKVNGLRTESRPSLNCPIELIKNQNLTIFHFKVHGLSSAQKLIYPGCEGQFWPNILIFRSCWKYTVFRIDQTLWSWSITFRTVDVQVRTVYFQVKTIYFINMSILILRPPPYLNQMILIIHLCDFKPVKGKQLLEICETFNITTSFQVQEDEITGAKACLNTNPNKTSNPTEAKETSVVNISAGNTYSKQRHLDEGMSHTSATWWREVIFFLRFSMDTNCSSSILFLFWLLFIR